MVNGSYRLIHNLASHLRYAILEDVARTATWKAIVTAGEAGEPTGWAYNYTEYMHRPEWQLCDVVADPLCLRNLAWEESHAATLREMQAALSAWQATTNDPWAQCTPSDAGGGSAHDDICSF